jgi:class 3 adenylate cyclase
MKNTASFLLRAILRYSIPGFVLGLVVLFFCSRYAIGQVEVLLSGINELNMNNLGFQIKSIPRSLFGELTTAFNRLSLQLEDTSEKEKTIVLPPQRDSFRQSVTLSSKLLPTQITRNQISVLFAGVKGFREYADNRTPEDVLVDLNEYFALAARVAAEYDGQVDKFIGDAVSCVFQSTPLKPDHTKRAVEAAVALQEVLADQGENGNDILDKIGIGISTGVALSGPVDALSNKIHTFIGESFKTAYSLNVLAEPGEIIISKDVFQAIEHLVMVEPIPPREMMDRTEAWENFRLKGLLPREDHEIPSR